jgi:hypothetical protein
MAAWDMTQNGLIGACTYINQMCRYEPETDEVYPLFSFRNLDTQGDWVRDIAAAEDGRIVLNVYTLVPDHNIWLYDPTSNLLSQLNPEPTFGYATIGGVEWFNRETLSQAMRTWSIAR